MGKAGAKAPAFYYAAVFAYCANMGLKVGFKRKNRIRNLILMRCFWWRRGELNPCPKADSQKLLRAQFIY